MKQVAIVEYGMGNLDSVKRAIEWCGGEPVITCDPDTLKQVDSIILPGVGAFTVGMANIRSRQLDLILAEQVFERGVPLLGICLGMQLLATIGREGGDTQGLGWIEGEVKRLKPDAPGTRIPHVGWNELQLAQLSPLFAGIRSGMDFYFVHSYHLVCNNPDNQLAATPYCGGFTAAIQKNNVFGVQFHPEKSQRAGIQVLKNFLQL